MFKRLFSFFLATVLLFGSLCLVSVADTSVSQNVTAFNGTRGYDYLVIYTYGGSYTGTNAYGTEVVVENGRVVTVGGNNSYIPSNGFVVSGHGTMKEWLDANVVVGMKVEYSTYYMTVTFTSDTQTATFATTLAREKALEAKEKALEGCYFYDTDADTRLAAAEAKYANLQSLTASQAKTLTAEYEALVYLYMERESVQYRGVWLRPTQRTWIEVENYVKKCSDAGINMICIETLYADTLIYPPKSGSYFNQNPYFKGFDVLDAFVNLSHKYGIELHVWMPIFYSGSPGSNNWELSVAAQKPEWQLVTKNGSNVGVDDSSGLVFLNPANDEVQDFLASTYKHLLENYNVDGFQLDYIRYRDRTGNDDFGYDSGTISKFKQAYPQYANTNISYNENAYYWNDWVKFRTQQVTKMVERVRGIIDDVAPNVILSADVGASLDSAYTLLYQDTATWLQNEWLDMLHPMAYGEGYAPYMKTFMSYCDDGCIVIPGLGAFIDELSGDELVLQAKEMVDVGCQGVIYFESSSFFSKSLNTKLTSTLFTEKTVAPAFDNEETVKAALETLKARIDKAKAEGKISSSVWNDILWQLNSALTENETNANAAVDYIRGIETQLTRVSSDILCDRIMLDASIALAAAMRDSADPDDEVDKSPIEPEVPEIETELQLIIDTINSFHSGEDSTIITNPNEASSKDYNLVYAYAMLLAPVEGKANCYKLVETHTGTGSDFTFNTKITEGMIVASFHTDSLGEGKDRVALAKTVEVGTELNLFGVDVKSKTFTSSVAMLYIGELNIVAGSGDVNGDGIVDQFDYLLVKRHYFATRLLTDDEKSRADVNGDGSINQFDYILIKRHYFGTYKIG